jgi:hypothetical protein
MTVRHCTLKDQKVAASDETQGVTSLSTKHVV